MIEHQATKLERRAIVIPIRQKPKRFIAVSGGKGGVGKSTVALNLAVLYAKQGSRTLVLDGDLGMADLNLFLGIAPRKSVLDFLGGAPMNEVVVPAHGIHLLAGLNGSQDLANLSESGRHRLLCGLKVMKREYETIVVDTSSGIGETNMAFTAAAKDVVVVATPEPLSLADAYASLKILSRQQGFKRAFLLPNAVRSSNEAAELCEQLSLLVDHFLGIELICLPSIPHDSVVPLAAASGVPLVLSYPDAPASRALLKVASALSAHIEQGAEISRGSITGRIGQ